MFQIWSSLKLCHLLNTNRKQGAVALIPLPDSPLAVLVCCRHENNIDVIWRNCS